jgi:hypothetical protein
LTWFDQPLKPDGQCADQHREDLCNWVKATGGTAAVLDYTTKVGCLPRVFTAP